MSYSTSPNTNLLIESLPARVRNKLLEDSALVDWTFGEVVNEANQIYGYVYFPVTGFISLLTVVGGHQPLEMGLIGNEGMLGISVVLGVKVTPLQSIVQGAGTAIRIPAKQFQRLLLDYPGLSNYLLRYIYVLMQQLTMAGACLHFHAIEPRLARWLLMTQDRIHADTFHLTHALLAQMLGVRRSGVSLAAEVLQEKNLIQYARGNINILDRQGLEAASCQCYQAMIDSYQQVMREK